MKKRHAYRLLAFGPIKCWATLYQYSSGTPRSMQPSLILSNHSSTGRSFFEFPKKTGPSFHLAKTGSKSNGLSLNALSIVYRKRQSADWERCGKSCLTWKKERTSCKVHGTYKEGGRSLDQLASLFVCGVLCGCFESYPGTPCPWTGSRVIAPRYKLKLTYRRPLILIHETHVVCVEIYTPHCVPSTAFRTSFSPQLAHKPRPSQQISWLLKSINPGKYTRECPTWRVNISIHHRWQVGNVDEKESRERGCSSNALL